MRRKILLGVILLGISYVLFFCISAFGTLFRLSNANIEDYSFNFDVARLVNVSNINQKHIICKQNELMESMWILDDSFLLTIVNVGSYSKKFEWKDMVRFQNEKIPNRSKWLNFNIATPGKQVLFSQYYLPAYNTLLLPFDEINVINVFIDNEIYKELLYNGNIMYMPIIAQSISFSFNGLNKNDLSFTNKNVDYLPCAVLFFYKENNRIYIGYIVKIRESEKRIVDILNI